MFDTGNISVWISLCAIALSLAAVGRRLFSLTGTRFPHLNDLPCERYEHDRFHRSFEIEAATYDEAINQIPKNGSTLNEYGYRVVSASITPFCVGKSQKWMMTVTYAKVA